MRKYVSVLIIVLIIFMLISIINKNYIWVIYTGIGLNILFIIMSIILKDKVRPILWSLFITIITIITLYFYFNKNVIPDNKSYYKKDNNFTDMIQDLQIRYNNINKYNDLQNSDQIENKYKDIYNRAIYIIKIEEEKLINQTNNADIYLHIGQVCELLWDMDNNTTWADCAAKRYDEYCSFDINNSECYFILAKFLSKDKNRTVEANTLIKKAIELSKDKYQLDKYNKLFSEITE